MEQIRAAHDNATEQPDQAQPDSSCGFKDLKTLNDLQLLYVGGGNAVVIFP